MEVGEGTSATNKSDMGVSHPYAISLMSSTCRNSFVVMARCDHIGNRNAKVRSPESEILEGFSSFFRLEDKLSNTHLLADSTAGALQNHRCR